MTTYSSLSNITIYLLVKFWTIHETIFRMTHKSKYTQFISFFLNRGQIAVEILTMKPNKMYYKLTLEISITLKFLDGEIVLFSFFSLWGFFYDFDFDIMLIQKYFRFSDIYTRLIYYNQNKLLSTLPLKNPCKVTGWFFRNNNIWNTRAFDLY